MGEVCYKWAFQWDYHLLKKWECSSQPCLITRGYIAIIKKNPAKNIPQQQSEKIFHFFFLAAFLLINPRFSLCWLWAPSRSWARSWMPEILSVASRGAVIYHAFWPCEKGEDPNIIRRSGRLLDILNEEKPIVFLGWNPPTWLWHAEMGFLSVFLKDLIKF